MPRPPASCPSDVADRLTFSERFACLNCGTSIPELEPRIFSFNSPHGACERCHGLGFQRIVDPDLVVPDPTLSLAEGALQPWRTGHSRYWRRLIEAVAKSKKIDVDEPWQDLTEDERKVFLFGTGSERHKVSYTNRFGRRRSYSVRFEGIVNNLERRYDETDSDAVRERVEGYMAEQACPDCGGRPAAAREPRGQGRRDLDLASTASSRRARRCGGSTRSR